MSNLIEYRINTYHNLEILNPQTVMTYEYYKEGLQLLADLAQQSQISKLSLTSKKFFAPKLIAICPYCGFKIYAQIDTCRFGAWMGENLCDVKTGLLGRLPEIGYETDGTESIMHPGLCPHFYRTQSFLDLRGQFPDPYQDGLKGDFQNQPERPLIMHTFADVNAYPSQIQMQRIMLDRWSKTELIREAFSLVVVAYFLDLPNFAERGRNNSASPGPFFTYPLPMPPGYEDNYVLEVHKLFYDLKFQMQSGRLKWLDLSNPENPKMRDDYAGWVRPEDTKARLYPLWIIYQFKSDGTKNVLCKETVQIEVREYKYDTEDFSGHPVKKGEQFVNAISGLVTMEPPYKWSEEEIADRLKGGGIGTKWNAPPAWRRVPEMNYDWSKRYIKPEDR